MNLIELKEKIKKYNVPDRWYSLDEGLKPDACILFKNYSIWEYFYLDEKGERHDYNFFNSDEDAYDFLWEKIEENLVTFRNYKKK